MGRYNFRPARVAQATKQLLDLNRLATAPAWLQPVNKYPPSQTLVRTQPVQHLRAKPYRKGKKPKQLYMPQKMAFEEDELREDFFKDHPWELARPRTILENDGKDYQRNDWDKSSQPGRSLDGESVVQRQMVLMADGLSRTKAFDRARKEFYQQRHDMEVTARVQREEALATGAYFGMSQMEVGMQLENETFDNFRAWAKQQVVLTEQARSAAYSGASIESSNEAEADSNSLGDAVDIIGRTSAASRNPNGVAPTN